MRMATGRTASRPLRMAATSAPKAWAMAAAPTALRTLCMPHRRSRTGSRARPTRRLNRNRPPDSISASSPRTKPPVP